uniref:VOC family protein n=1 Tax=Cephaloticoccus sp. TaxID=1985742 RepID=UPI00404ABEE4
MITRLDHIQLAMPPGEEDKARAFWHGILGMMEEVKPEPLANRGGCWFRTDKVIIHCGVEQDFTTQRKAHPAFCVRDFDGLAQRLTAAGYPVIPDEVLPNRRRFYTADPFGNRIEFIQDGDGFGQK